MKILTLLLLLVSQLTFGKDIPVKNFCGAYASVIKNIGTNYSLFSNSSPYPEEPCPGLGCPGITRYDGLLTNPSYKGVVAPNSIIDDVFNADGSLSNDRMFSRPVVAKSGRGYVAVAMVLNGYPSKDNTGIPAWLTSYDGFNWVYHGKFKGEPAGIKLFGSGMGLIVEKSGTPKYRFYTDGYGVKTALLKSDGNNIWTFERNTDESIKEIAPIGWTGSIFQSAAKVNGVYYLSASNTWPVTQWAYSHSADGVNFIADRFESVSIDKKNVSLFGVNNLNLMALVTTRYTGSCYKKAVRNLPE